MIDVGTSLAPDTSMTVCLECARGVKQEGEPLSVAPIRM